MWRRPRSTVNGVESAGHPPGRPAPGPIIVSKSFYGRSRAEDLIALGLAVTLIAAAGCRRDEPPAPPEEHTQTEPASPTSESAPAPARPPSGDLSAAGPSLTAPRTQPTASQPDTQESAEPTLPTPPTLHPLADAIKGEWALYAALDEQTLRYRITRVSTLDVDIRVTVERAGRPVGFPATRTDPRRFDPMDLWPDHPGRERSVKESTARAAGRDWTALLVEDRWTDEDVRYVRRTWIAPEVPVFGLIRMELFGDDVLEARLILEEHGGTKPRWRDGENVEIERPSQPATAR